MRYLLDTHTAIWALPLFHSDPFDRIIIATAKKLLSDAYIG